MPHNKKPSPANLAVKQQIVDALFQCLKEKNLTDITVQEVCQRAKVSRMGFYRNYVTLEDVIENYIDQCFNAAINAIKAERPLNINGKSILITTLKHFQKHTAYLQILVAQKLDLILLNCYHKAMDLIYQEAKPKVSPYCVNMLAGELFGLEMAWLRNGMKESPEEMADLYYQFTKLKYDSFT